MFEIWVFPVLPTRIYTVICKVFSLFKDIMGGALSHEDPFESDSSDQEEGGVEVSNTDESAPENLDMESSGPNGPNNLADDSAGSTDSVTVDSLTSIHPNPTVQRPESCSKIVNRSTRKLGLDDVQAIDNELELDEKISVLYLVHDDAQRALRESAVLFTNVKDTVLCRWVQSQQKTGLEWQKRLVEALCIVQNYKVLKQLGFQRQELNAQFLPSHIFLTVSVSKFHKLMYFVCEKLMRDETATFLGLVRQDFQRRLPHVPFHQFNQDYLEMYFMYWQNVSYVRPDNIDSIYAIFKEMENNEICRVLKNYMEESVMVTPQPTSPPPPPLIVEKPNNLRIVERKFSNNKAVDNSAANHNIFDQILNDTTLQDLVQANVPEKTGLASPYQDSSNSFLYPESLGAACNDLDRRYPIDPKNPGIVLIINQEAFYRDIRKEYQHLLPSVTNILESRTGTSKDRDDLNSTFKRFGLTTIIENDLNHIDVVKKIKEVAESIRNESSFFVCILSHGDEGVVYGVNSCRIEVSKIQEAMRTTNLKHLQRKPKVLILQSCQGRSCQRVVTEDDEITTDGPTQNQAVPITVDLLTFWATVPGFGAIRHKRNGTWFIQSLCENMISCGATYHFEDICTKIINDVSEKKWQQKDIGEVAMVPIKVTTLTKHLYLPPIKRM